MLDQNDINILKKKCYNLIETHFKSDIYIDTKNEDNDRPLMIFEISYLLYKSFQLIIYCEKSNPYGGEGIELLLVVGEEKVTVNKISIKNIKSFFYVDNLRGIEESLKMLDEELRLRLPDKFLAQFD